MKKRSKCLFYLLLILVIAIVLRIAIGEPCRVSSDSMRPTILPGDWLWIDKATCGGKLPSCWADIPLVNIFTWVPFLKKADAQIDWGFHRMPGIRKPEVGDVIVFQSIEGKGDLLVKRIGFQLLAGDSIELSPDNIHEYRSVIKQEMSVYTNRSCVDPDRIERLRLSENYYFVLGDNLDNSRDSRHFGFIPESSIVGRINIVLFSVSQRSENELGANSGRLFRKIK